jgi:catechol 2,3-dioxygenase-like lactoylglutathione lyase family enzyme
MIIGIAQIALLVRDYDEALDFYCNKLGFIIVEDTELLSKRWIRIKPNGDNSSEILVSKAINEEQFAIIGKQAGGRVFLFLHTDDLDSDFKKLKLNNVEFVENPRIEKYGKIAVFKDLYGNRIDLIQPSI